MARLLTLFGASITTARIRPAGTIQPSSPAGLYLQQQEVEPLDLNDAAMPYQARDKPLVILAGQEAQGAVGIGQPKGQNFWE